jgi:hypothetical protein
MRIADLEPAIAGYFSSSNARDAEAFASCFAPDAVVRDEEAKDITGADALREWLTRTAGEYGFHSEPVEALDRGERTVVKARVTGDFPGSPIDLYYDFALRDGRIARLEIGDRLP